MNAQNIKKQIKELTGIDKNIVISVLSSNKTLTPEEKNAIFIYLFPIKLLDKDLPGKINSEKEEDSKVIMLLGAYRTEQYGRYIKHLLHSFLDPKDIYPLLGRHITNCCICDKNIYHTEIWKEECSKFPKLKEKEKKECLSYGSKKSSLEICLNCLIRLKKLDNLLSVIEGKDYLENAHMIAL